MEENNRQGIVFLVPNLRRFARCLLRNEFDADDLVFTVIEGAAVKGEPNDPDIDARLHFYKSVFRRFSTLLGSDTFEQNVIVWDFGLGGTGSRRSSKYPIAAKNLNNAFYSLELDYRSVLACVIVEGMTYAEAGAVLGLPVKEIESRLVVGRRRLLFLAAAMAKNSTNGSTSVGDEDLMEGC